MFDPHIFISVFQDSDLDHEGMGDIICSNIVYTLFPVDLVEQYINDLDYQTEVKVYILKQSASKYSKSDKIVIITILAEKFYEQI